MSYHTVSRLKIESYQPNIEYDFNLACDSELLRNGIFYMYHEIRNYPELRHIRSRRGTIIYPRDYNPDKIQWYIEDGELIHDDNIDDMSISSLRFILDSFLNPLGCKVNGLVYHIDAVKDRVFAFKVENGIIHYNFNYTLDSNAIYKKCCLLADEGLISDDNFRILISRYYPNDTYKECSAIDIFENFIDDYI
jgi:hypothetical protein